MYLISIGWFRKRPRTENFASHAQKGKGEINMSIDKWLEQYGAEQGLNEYGEPIEQDEPEQEEEVQDVQEDSESADEPEQDADMQESEDQEQVDDEPVVEQTKKQSKEENAYYAEKRRQEQLERQVQDRLRQTKEYQTTQLLSEIYGVPQEELYDKLYEAKLAREAKEKNVPVEYLREREELRKQQETLQEQMQQLMFQQWQSRVESEKSQLKQRFAMLSDSDLDDAASYMLETMGRTDLPLEQAAFALHGAKILGGLKEVAKNEALAEVSGRKKSPLPVKGGKSSDAVTLSDEEKYVAKKLGMSEKEYYKWKEGN
jgi:hypothetical protein